MIPYARQSVDESDIQAVAQVLRSDFLTQGPVVPQFEDAVASYCGATYAVAVSSGTAALHIAARALGLGPGGLLWTSPNSFVASANCALYCGADVDFVDIDPRTFCMSVSALEEKLTAARATGRLPDVVVTVDFAGQPCDMKAIARLRAEYGFKIVEDASHAVGALYNEERAGSGRYADVTVFSFHPVKIVTTAEGGMALTNDPDLADTMQLLRSHGITRDARKMESARAPWEYEQLDLGFNYRLTEIQAALGLQQMQRIDAFIERRRAIAARYARAFESPGVTVQEEPAFARSAYHLYAVQVPDRAGMYERLRASGIAPNVHYMPIYTQPYYRAMGFQTGYCPNAERYYEHAISLPMYAGLDEAQQERVIEAVLAALPVESR